jgi:hypothetical protein
MVIHTCNSSTWKAEAKGLQVQPELHSKCHTNLGHVARPCLKKEKEEKKYCNRFPHPWRHILAKLAKFNWRIEIT